MPEAEVRQRTVQALAATYKDFRDSGRPLDEFKSEASKLGLPTELWNPQEGSGEAERKPWELPPTSIGPPRPGSKPLPEADLLPQEIAFHAERALGSRLERAPKQPESLAFLSEEKAKEVGIPFPGMASALTDPHSYVAGKLMVAAGLPLAKFAAKTKLGQAAISGAKKAGKGALEFGVEKIVKPIGKRIAGRMEAKAKSEFIKKSLSMAPEPGKVILPGGKPTSVIIPGQTLPSRVIMPGEAAPARELILPSGAKVPVPKGVEFPTAGVKPSRAFKEPESVTPRLDSMIAPEKSKDLFDAAGNMLPSGEKMMTMFLDRYTPIYNFASSAAKATGKAVPFEENPYYAARRYMGVFGKVENRLDKLREILSPVRKSGDIENLETVMVAYRSIERSNRGITNPSNVRMSEAIFERSELKRKLGPEKFKVLEDAYSRIKSEIGDDLMHLLEREGVFGSGEAKNIISKNEHWVPFDIAEYVADDVADRLIGRKSISVTSDEIIHKMTGTTKKMRRPLESLVSRIYKTISLAERNGVMRKVVNLKNLGPEMDGLVITGKENLKRLPEGFKAVPYFENGVKMEVGLPSAVADSISGMNQFGVDFITQMGSMGAKALRLGATSWNLPFIFISNPVRDFQTVGLTTGKGWGIAPDIVRGLFDFIGKSSYFKEFMEHGGAQSGIMSQFAAAPQGAKYVTESGTRRFAKTITNPIALMEYLGQAIEVAPRMAAFRVARKAGASPQKAAYMARNATVDFSKAGTVGKVFNMWVPFLNARAQGSVIIGQKLIESPAKSMMNIASMVWLPAATTNAYNRMFFGDLYDRVPEQDKENNFIIMLGEKQDELGRMQPHYVAIPKGDIGRIFGNPVEAVINWSFFNGKMDVPELMLKAVSDALPVDIEYEGKFRPGRAAALMTPPFLQALHESQTGRSIYYQNDIVPKELQGVKTKSLQYTTRTPKALRWLGEKTGQSPMMMENFLRRNLGSGIFQVIDPVSIPNMMRGKVVKIRGGDDAREVYEFRENVRGEKADVRVEMRHALNGLLTGSPEEQDASMQTMTRLLQQVPGKNRSKFMKYQIESVMGKRMPQKARAMETLSKEEKQRYVMEQFLQQGKQ